MSKQIVKATSNEVVILSPTNKVALQKLLPQQRKMIEAGLRPKVKELAPLKVVTDFVAIITTAYTIAGQKPDEATLALYADELYNKLMETYPAITIDEVRAALRAGVYGEYG